MRRSDREIVEWNEIQKILENSRYLHLALFDDEYPYIVPLHYGYETIDGKVNFYMHGAKEGHKIDLIKKNGNACIEIENNVELLSGGDVPCKYSSTYSSFVARGKVAIVSDEKEKIHALQTMMFHQTGRKFEMDGKMAVMVEVFKFTADSYSAKAKTMPQ
ncbi:MAG: pyridoxamine 5'-phosphate oxidase family protein [Butyrivibrio sp.]|nr:pyridoxamine 5'-phosphate oxidase family protein [Butyrivibrio sp.]